MELADFLVQYWQILGALVLAVVVWTKHTVEVGRLTKSHTEMEGKLEKLDDKIVTIDLTYVRLQTDIVEIKTSLKYIEQKLDKNSNKLGL